MKIIKNHEVPNEEAHSYAFLGGPVKMQVLVDSDMSRFFSFNVVNFNPGARTRFHTHSSDQILYVTAGKGIVATDEEEIIVTEGTTIHIPAGEKHSHGAASDSEFSHIALVTTDSVSEFLE